MKILFSNIGYARGIDGSLWHHISRAPRHFFIGAVAQNRVLSQLRTIIGEQKPDLCCFVEIDAGSFHSANLNQIQALADNMYCHSDIAGKYGPGSWLARAPLHTGKSNGFLSLKRFPFERLYFKAGRKRLIYRLDLPENIALYFAHFSLSEKVRARQFQEIEVLLERDGRESILLADFNIFKGFSEIDTLLRNAKLTVMNDGITPTFTFHRKKRILDLCICSNSLKGRLRLDIIPQPFSDHAALCVKIGSKE